MLICQSKRQVYKETLTKGNDKHLGRDKDDQVRAGGTGWRNTEGKTTGNTENTGRDAKVNVTETTDPDSGKKGEITCSKSQNYN